MRILFLANSDVGLYKFRKELIEVLSRKNKVFICSPNGKYIPELIKIGVKYIPCKLVGRGLNPVQEIHLLFTYWNIVNKYKPDIVFTYTIKPNIYGGLVCAKKSIPYVTNITGLGSAIENEGMLQKIVLFLYRKALNKAQKVFFQNTENRNFMLERKIVEKAYDLLPGSGVNLDQYCILDYPDDSVVHFVFIARIMKEKGIEEYLEAAGYIKNKYPNTRFHICGPCLEEGYKKRIHFLQKKGIVIYHGEIEDMLDIYKKVHCIVHPTYYPEGISNVLLESCACARPIIATNRSGCREVIDEGKNGLFVKQKDGKDLIRVIEKFLLLNWKEKREMGLAGRKKVEKEFDRQIVIRKYLEEIAN